MKSEKTAHRIKKPLTAILIGCFSVFVTVFAAYGAAAFGMNIIESFIPQGLFLSFMAASVLIGIIGYFVEKKLKKVFDNNGFLVLLIFFLPPVTLISLYMIIFKIIMKSGNFDSVSSAISMIFLTAGLELGGLIFYLVLSGFSSFIKNKKSQKSDNHLIQKENE